MSSVSKSKTFEKNPYWDENEGLEFEERNKALKRPLSPHLSAYKFQSNMMISMGHRITGVVLYGMLFGLAAGTFVLTLLSSTSSDERSAGKGAVFSPVPFPHAIGMLADLHASPAAWTAAKFVIAYPFASHATSGVRHLITDSGYWLTIRGVNFTSWAVIVISAALSLHWATL